MFENNFYSSIKTMFTDKTKEVFMGIMRSSKTIFNKGECIPPMKDDSTRISRQGYDTIKGRRHFQVKWFHSVRFSGITTRYGTIQCKSVRCNEFLVILQDECQYCKYSTSFNEIVIYIQFELRTKFTSIYFLIYKCRMDLCCAFFALCNPHWQHWWKLNNIPTSLHSVRRKSEWLMRLPNRGLKIIFPLRKYYLCIYLHFIMNVFYLLNWRICLTKQQLV